MQDPGEIAAFYDRCSDLMRELLDALASTPGEPRAFPVIEDAIGWPRRRIASVLGGVWRLRQTAFAGRRPYRFLDDRVSPSGRWEIWMDERQAAAVRDAAEQVVLEACGVRLRPWRAGDAQAVEEIAGDPVVARWSGLASEGAAAWIARQLDRSDGISLAVTVPPDRGAVGKVALGAHDRSARCAELSYWVLPRARGKGVAAAAARALCSWGFTYLGLRTIVLDIEEDNGPSLRLAAALGAVPAGTHVERDRTGVARTLVLHTLARGGFPLHRRT
jgi:RimJ/RimL family protein N-acetyltransferase